MLSSEPAALNWLIGILGQIDEPRRGREALAGAAHHGLGKDPRAPQMFGIGRIEPLLDGAHQQSAVGRSLSYYFRRQLQAAGEREPWARRMFPSSVQRMQVSGFLRDGLDVKLIPRTFMGQFGPVRQEDH